MGTINWGDTDAENFDAIDVDVKIGTIFFAVRYLMTAEDLELKDNESDDDLGCEFDMWYTYKLNKQVQLKIDAAI